MDAQLRAAWCQTLGLEKSDVSDDSNFFSEGGDSVMAMRLISAARDRNIALDTETIFNHPVFMDMSNFCRPLEEPNKHQGDTMPELGERLIQACAEACGVQREMIEDVFPTADNQAWHFYQHIASGAWILQTVFESIGAFDLDLLRQTWQLLHDKNQILRTRLVEYDDQVLQVVVNDKIQWGSGYSLAKYKASDMEKRVGSGDPLFRYGMVSEGDRKFVVWTCHHGGFDGWTRRLIMDKLQEGLLNLRRLESEPHGPTFKGFVEWRQSKSGKKDQAEAFWDRYIAGYKHLEGLRRPSSDYVSLTSSQLFRTIELKKTAGTESSITTSIIGHAAWALAVGSLWDVEDVIFASIKMGRQMTGDNPVARVESVMGPTFASTVVRVALRKDMTVGDYLQQIQRQLIATIPFEHDGFLATMKCFAGGAVVPGVIDWHPLGSDLFSRTLEYKGPQGEVGCLQPRVDLSVNFTSNTSMLVDIYEHVQHLNLRVSYDANVWTEERVAELVDTFSGILTKMLASRNWKLAEVFPSGAAEGPKKLKARL